VGEEFFKIVDARNTEDGEVLDENLRRRMRHPICLKCQESYRKKFPGKPFGIVCDGVWADQDIEELYESAKGTEDEVPLEETREIYDPVYWASKYIRLPDEYGDYKPFQARSYQEEILRCTARRKVDRCGRGTGKALSLDTPIPTLSGWKTMKDLKVGDQAFDEAGRPCNVVATTEVMHDRPCYRVKFSDGSEIVADARHQWVTLDKRARKEFGRRKQKQRPPKYLRCPDIGPKIHTTEEIKDTLYAKCKKQEINHSIPLCGPIQYEKKDLPIAPYTLGAWLGDGTAGSPELTCADPEILLGVVEDGYYPIPHSYEEAAPRYGLQVQGQHGPGRDEVSGRFTSNGSFQSLLGQENLLGNKHVPEIYLRASVEQRLALLQGLMDTDGSCTEDQCWAEFCNTNKNLAEAVFELITSLGMKPCFGEGRATLYGVDCGPRYRVGFFPTMPVFRIPRKLARIHQAQRPTVKQRYIVAIEEIPSVPVRCIEVDSPTHLYLAGKACIPTHNSALGVIEELQKACTRKNYKILIACPAKAQAEMWFAAINEQLKHSQELNESIARQKQAPYHIVEFLNGSEITIFTTGSTSGKESDTLRGQSPRRIRIDEQDLLNPGDYKAIMPLLRRFKETEFHGSSTPTGKRETYWAMCTQYRDYREFHFPASVLPDWGSEMEEACRREARTEIVYQHEFEAEFGDLESGVFKPAYIDVARKPYKYRECVYRTSWKYFMGVDWNGKGTGTRIRIVGYNVNDPKDKPGLRRVVDLDTVDKSTLETLQRIRALNKKWHCEAIYIDRGYGQVQDELLRLIGKTNKDDPDDVKLLDIQIIDFGATLKTNRLVPKRENSKYLDEEENETERPTKPFTVEGAVMAFEEGLVEFSDDDPILEEQLRGYRVKTWSAHGYANTYDCKVGDHDLIALMLALLGIELKYGMFRDYKRFRPAVPGIKHVTGIGGTAVNDPYASQAEIQSLVREINRQTSGVPSRALPEQKPEFQVHYARTYPGGRYGHMAIVGPRRSPAVQVPSRGAVPSRTSIFIQMPGRRFR
jgi:hypothetical protein